jgi:hypothetical protein
VHNAPTEATIGSNPPGGTAVPAYFKDGGNLILSGALLGFTTQITKTGTNPANGSFRINSYTFTGGSLLSLVAGATPLLMQGVWCVATCVPSNGYSAHPDGKYDAVPVRTSTWGTIKQLYR